MSLDGDIAHALRSRPSWRGAKSALMSGLMVVAVILILIPLVAVVWSVVSRGAGIALRAFPAFLTHDIPLVSRRAGPGMGPAILGTLLVTGGATRRLCGARQGGVSPCSRGGQCAGDRADFPAGQ